MKKFLTKHRTEDKIYRDWSTQAFMAKVLYLYRLIGTCKGDVIFYGDSLAVKFALFLAVLTNANREIKLHIVSNLSDVKKLILLEGTGCVFYQANYDYENKDVLTSYYFHRNRVNAIFEIFPHSLLNDDSTGVLVCTDILYKENYAESLEDLEYSKIEKKDYLTFLKRIGSPSFWKNQDVLTFNFEGKDYTYTYENVMSMIESIDDEFSKVERYHADVNKLTFEKGFAYMTYFFLRGDKVDFNGNNIFQSQFQIQTGKILPKLVFCSEEEFKKDYHTTLKYVLFDRLNRFLSKFKMTEWLLYIRMNKAIRMSYNLRSKRDELLVIVGATPAYIYSNLFHKIKTKVSILFGTPVDGFTLGVNRYSDKKLPMLGTNADEYRIMFGNKIGTDTLQRINVGGNKIHPTFKSSYPYFSKSKDKFFNTNIYGSIDGDILLVFAEQKDVYFNKDDEPWFLINKKRALESIPEVKDVFIMKHKKFKNLIAFISLDYDFIERQFEEGSRNYTALQLHLNEIKTFLNRNDADNGIIDLIIPYDKFFKRAKSFNKFGSIEDYVNILSHQPLDSAGGF